MDFAALHDVTWRAGFRIDWAALLRLSGKHPEPVQDWVAAAGEFAAADTGHRLLSATAAGLRDLIAGSPAEHLYQYADQLAEACDLLTQADQACDDAMGQLTTACHELAALDRTALVPDPDGPGGTPTTGAAGPPHPRRTNSNPALSPYSTAPAQAPARPTPPRRLTPTRRPQPANDRKRYHWEETTMPRTNPTPGGDPNRPDARSTGGQAPTGGPQTSDEPGVTLIHTPDLQVPHGRLAVSSLHQLQTHKRGGVRRRPHPWTGSSPGGSKTTATAARPPTTVSTPARSTGDTWPTTSRPAATAASRYPRSSSWTR